MNVGPNMYAIVIEEGPNKGLLVWVEAYADHWSRMRGQHTWWVVPQELCIGHQMNMLGVVIGDIDASPGEKMICADAVLRPLRGPSMELSKQQLRTIFDEYWSLT